MMFQIALAPYDQGMFTLFRDGIALFHEIDDEIRRPEQLFCPVDPFFLHGIPALSETGGIIQPNGNAIDYVCFLDVVASRPRNIGDDGTPLLKQQVEQELFPTLVRPASTTLAPLPYRRPNR